MVIRKGSFSKKPMKSTRRSLMAAFHTNRLTVAAGCLVGKDSAPLRAGEANGGECYTLLHNWVLKLALRSEILFQCEVSGWFVCFRLICLTQPTIAEDNCRLQTGSYYMLE